MQEPTDASGREPRTTTLPDTIVDWSEVTAERLTALAHFASKRGVQLTDQEATGFVAITIRRDAARAIAQAKALVVTRPAPTQVRPGTITAIGVAEVVRPDGPYLLLRRGAQVFLVPDMPNGWDFREPWFGDINSVRWLGGPPAYAAFRRVGAPV